jgi:hypothetical protein
MITSGADAAFGISDRNSLRPFLTLMDRIYRIKSKTYQGTFKAFHPVHPVHPVYPCSNSLLAPKDFCTSISFI